MSTALDLPRARRTAGHMAAELGRVFEQLDLLERSTQAGVIARQTDRLLTQHEACVTAAQSLITLRDHIEDVLAALPPPRLGGGK